MSADIHEFTTDLAIRDEPIAHANAIGHDKEGDFSGMRPRAASFAGTSFATAHFPGTSFTGTSVPGSRFSLASAFAGTVAFTGSPFPGTIAFASALAGTISLATVFTFSIAGTAFARFLTFTRTLLAGSLPFAGPSVPGASFT